MNLRVVLTQTALALVLAATPAQARLGETEAQSQARYGAPTPELTAAIDQPLIPGATEVLYKFQGWRVRVAFLNGVAAKIEYVHLPEGGVAKQISEDELKALLEAEKGTSTWREEKPKSRRKDLNLFGVFTEGRQWTRGDQARASLRENAWFVAEGREVEAYLKKLPAQAKPAR